MPKSAQTGTQKKATKQLAHELRKSAATREKGIKKSASFMHGGNRNIAIEKDLKKTMGALEDYRHSDKYKSLAEFTRGGKAYKGAEDFKGLKPFEYGGKAYQDPDFYKEGKEGYKMAQRVLEPIQQDALRNYSLSTIPGVVNQYGGEGKSSSALQQAIAASKQNLASQLHAQTAGLAAQYGGDISRMNLAERGRQQEMQQNTALNRAQMNMAQQAQQQALQYGAASDIFQGKRAASMGLDEQRRANIEYLNNLAMQASFNAQGAGLGAQGGAFQQAYLQKGTSQPSPWATLGAGLLQAGGTAAGAYFGGPMGAAAGNAAGRTVSQSLFGTNQL